MNSRGWLVVLAAVGSMTAGCAGSDSWTADAGTAPALGEDAAPLPATDAGGLTADAGTTATPDAGDVGDAHANILDSAPAQWGDGGWVNATYSRTITTLFADAGGTQTLACNPGDKILSGTCSVAMGTQEASGQFGGDSDGGYDAGLTFDAGDGGAPDIEGWYCTCVPTNPQTTPCAITLTIDCLPRTN